MSKKIVDHKSYWEDNIEGFSNFYDKNSEEAFNTNPLFGFFYRKFLLPIEKYYMGKRYDMVDAFVKNEIPPKSTVAEIGCGNGIFVKKFAEKNCKVFAIDYTKSALELTKKTLGEQLLKNVTLLHQDITDKPIPKSDAAIAIGVLPYIQEPDDFFKNVLPNVDQLLWNFLDTNNKFNILRKAIRFIDVRGYYYHSLDDIKKNISKYGFEITKISPLATGFVVQAKRKEQDKVKRD